MLNLTANYDKKNSCIIAIFSRRKKINYVCKVLKRVVQNKKLKTSNGSHIK